VCRSTIESWGDVGWRGLNDVSIEKISRKKTAILMAALGYWEGGYMGAQILHRTAVGLLAATAL